VASNYRHYDPWPIFVKDASGSKFRDLDGNEYIDHNLTFGALMAGHCHPAVMKAVEKRLSTGTMFGMPHDMEWELAEEICNRFPVEMVRFGNSGTEATMHAIRLARAATGRDKIIKFEGAYHGLHDSAWSASKPHAPDFGDIDDPTPVPGGLGVPKSAIANVLIATFNDLGQRRAPLQRKSRRDRRDYSRAHSHERRPLHAAARLPEGPARSRHEIRRAPDLRRSKTGAKLGWGGASEYFNVHPDMICLAKSIGGGLPLAAFGASKSVMDLISQHKVFHGGTYNTNPVSMAAGLATFREVLTRDNYAHVDKLGKKLAEGYRKTIAKVGLQAYIAQAGANGALMLYPKEIRNYRDWTTIDIDLWRHYWFAMVNRGVMPQPYWWDEQWTISVQHTEADIDKHLQPSTTSPHRWPKRSKNAIGQPVLAAH
jgi:glutamate-1-semialdehyde 2,1-aminomutase